MLMCIMAVEGVRNKLRFGQLVFKYEKLMFRIAYRILNSEKDAEDAVQEAFLSIAKNFSKISVLDDNKMRSYLITIVRHAAFKVYNANKKHNGVSVRDVNVYIDSMMIG